MVLQVWLLEPECLEFTGAISSRGKVEENAQKPRAIVKVLYVDCLREKTKRFDLLSHIFMAIIQF